MGLPRNVSTLVGCVDKELIFVDMGKQSREILQRYWGYASFRPMQEEIVDAVISGNDTLALLPTGGGKSVCFQVPAMVMDGMCLVVTPLIALMKDQVQHLKNIGIPAAAIYSGMHFNELEIVYNHCVFGKLKFLYVSPERLQSERFMELLKRMKINLIAVDESHCISQWGYDFRPPYLQIADIRPYVPNVPVLALTATATPAVVNDIQEKLVFRKKNVFQTSYERKNLTYNVIHHPDKYGTLQRLFQAMTTGSGIVYVRSRKKTRDIADFLTSKGILATSYHAGLDARQRDSRQSDWMRGKVRVMVATNAFGMGIDKPDVRLVVHLEPPDSLEAYFQEAGRGGRDGKASEAYLLVADQDVKQLKSNLDISYPEPKKIKAVYQALGNYFQLPIGGGKDQSFDFDITAFCNNYNMPILEVFASLQLLEKEGYLLMTEGLKTPARIFLQCNREQLYRFQVEQPAYDAFIKNLLRSYPGLFTDFISLREEDISRKTGIPTDQVIAMLQKLDRLSFLAYVPRKEKPQLIYTIERNETERLTFSKEHYGDRKNNAAKRLQTVIDFVYNNEKCRSIQLLEYFGERLDRRCGNCDVCTKRNKLQLNDIEFENIQAQLKVVLAERPYPLFEVMGKVKGYSEEKVLTAIRFMLENRILAKDASERLVFRKQLDFN